MFSALNVRGGNCVRVLESSKVTGTEGLLNSGHYVNLFNTKNMCNISAKMTSPHITHTDTQIQSIDS